MLLNAWRECDSSKKFEKSNERQIRIKERIAKKPAKLNAPLSKTNRSRINFAPEKNNIDSVKNLKRKYQKCGNREI